MNANHESNGKVAEVATATATAVPKKKPEREDLSRWENEGGTPSLPKDVAASENGEKLEQLAMRFLHEGQQAFGHLKDRLEKEVRDRPLAALGVASAVGFAMGGGLRSRQGRKLAKRALRYGLDQLEQLKDLKSKK